MTMTRTMSMALPRTHRWVPLVACTLALVGMSLFAEGTAHANLTFENVGVDTTGVAPMDPNTGLFPEFGLFSRQAGAHPDFTFSFALPVVSNANIGGTISAGPPEAVHAVEIDLPPGFVGDPTALPTCSPQNLASPGKGGATCPLASQIGVAEGATAEVQGPSNFKVGVYNIAHGPDVSARFGFNYEGVIALLNVRVRPEDYGISSGSSGISQGAALQSAKVVFWGVPADPSHDGWRQLPEELDVTGVPHSTEAPRVPFLTAPTSCGDTPVSLTVRGDSWEHRNVFDTRTFTVDQDGTPFVYEGCERVPFAPAVEVRPLSRVADAPTGLNVDVDVPQANDPDGVGTAHVRRVVMTFPKGMSVSPASASGLGACAPSDIKLGTNDAPTCPDSSKIGAVTIETPLLDTPLTGDVILATQDDNPFHTLLAAYIAVKGPDFYVKLPGRVDLDQATGQLTATFDNTPQVPFSHLHVAFPGGSQAAFATPPTCGTYNTHIEVTSWASSTPVPLDSPMTIDQNCDAGAFAPSFTAGTTNPLAGQNSTFSLTLTRADRTPYLAGVSTALPAGLLANIGSVPQCDPIPAEAGFCPPESQIGTTTVLSGPGQQPLSVKGQIYLTGPYRNPETGQDAPFGLSIAVPTAGQAGPFDLNVITTRAGIYVDRTDGHATVKTDPLPTIIQGIPLRIRQVNVLVDRSHFMFNPTNCTKKTIFGSFTALGGGSSDQVVPFQVGGCGDLDLNQKLKLKFTGKNSTKDGAHPGIDATLTDSGGGANLQKAEVKLPLSIALDPDNAQALCKPEERVALKCPKASIVGQATAVSVLPHPLTGPVYFVEGLRKSATGRTIHTLPKLWIPLSGDGVTIDVNASSAVDSTKRLQTTFDAVPDAPIKQFHLKISGGKHGVLVVSGKPGTCERDKTIDSRFTGQNGQVLVSGSKVTVEGCKPTVKKTKTTAKAVTLQVDNLGAGRLTLSGGTLLRRSSKTLKSTTEASITATLTTKARAALRRHGRVALRLSIVYRPSDGKAVIVTKSVIVRS
jgi:hypothetical protein